MQKTMLTVVAAWTMSSRAGRGESPADPAGPNEADVLASLTPIEDRPRDMTQEKIANEGSARSSQPSRALIW